MVTYLNSRLTYVWAFLTVMTVVSWWIGRSSRVQYEVNALITVGVLVFAALKAQLVIMYFMEVRSSPAWLQRTAYGWVVVLFLLLLGSYGWSNLV